MTSRTTFIHPSEASLATDEILSHTKATKTEQASNMPLLPVERYDHRKGLKSLQVHQTIMSQDGRIWSATPAGLACYDGVNVNMFNRKHGLSSHGLRTIALHPDGSLWLGTDIGIEVLDISGFVPLVLWSANIGTVNCLDISDKTGVIGTSQGLFIWKSGQVISRSENQNLSHATIKNVLKDGNRIWVIGAKLGLISLDKGDITTPKIEIIGTPTVLTRTSNDHIIVGGTQGVAIIDPQGLCKTHLPTKNKVIALHDYDGLIWTGSGGGVFRLRFENEQLRRVDTVLNDISANHIMNDNFDNIWISTADQALLRMSAMRKTFSEEFNVDTGSTLCIYRKDDKILVGGTNGAVILNNQTLLDDILVWDILEDEFGKIWFATEEGLYCRVNPHFTIAYRHSDSDVVAAPCRSMVFYEGRLYVSSIRGLAVIGAQGITEVLDPDGSSFGYVYSLHVGPKGHLWIATLGRGIFRMKGDDVTAVKLAGLADNSNVYAFTHDPHGCIYAAHDNIISKIDLAGEASVLVDADVAIAAWVLKCLPGDRLVAGTSNGLIIYDTSNGAVRHKISGSFDDVPWEFTTSRSLEISDGQTLYCGLGSGLRKVDIDALTQTELRPRAVFTDASWRGVTPFQKNKTIQVETGFWHLYVSFRTCWYLDDCSMRTRLVGFDEDWSLPSPVGEIHYTSLPAGHYSLEVKIQSPMAGEGPAEQIFKFSVI